jgi:hypothetical protein
VISLLVVVIVASIAVASMITGGWSNTSVLRHDQALLALMGLDQRWDIFAPDPRRRVVDVRGQIAYADGDVERWHLPRGAPVVGGYWDARWRKWMDNAMLAGPRSELWPGLAAWLGRERAESGRQPVRITLVGRYYDQRPPGATPLRGPWRDLVVYRLDGPPFQAARLGGGRP